MSKRGKKNNHQEEVSDPDRFVEVDNFMLRGRGRENPHLPATYRPDTFGIRTPSGCELLSFAGVDDDY
jgi:hypothetical protein